MLDSASTLRRARLRYVRDTGPGITRTRRGSFFTYREPSGKRLTHKATLARIASLAIPPAWTNVWICPSPRGHIQATGFDARRRKQYRYHPGWIPERNRAKFDTLIQFALALPAIRTRIDRDLRLPGLPRERVAACIVHLMDRTLIRVGNAEYARVNHSYGLTTILNRHAHVSGATIRFKFKAKSGRLCELALDSPRAARIVRACQDLPGQELFCYRDDRTGRIRDIGSAHVNAYLAAITGSAFTAKDFRTWGGTCAAAGALHKLGSLPSKNRASALKRAELAAIRAAADALGNTPAVCRKFYIHEALIDHYAAGRLHAAFVRAPGHRRLSACERAVLRVLASRSNRRRPFPQA